VCKKGLADALCIGGGQGVALASRARLIGAGAGLKVDQSAHFPCIGRACDLPSFRRSDFYSRLLRKCPWRPDQERHKLHASTHTGILLTEMRILLQGYQSTSAQRFYILQTGPLAHRLANTAASTKETIMKALALLERGGNARHAGISRNDSRKAPVLIQCRYRPAWGGWDVLGAFGWRRVILRDSRPKGVRPH